MAHAPRQGRHAGMDARCYHKHASVSGCPECGLSWTECSDDWEASGCPESWAPGNWDPSLGQAK